MGILSKFSVLFALKNLIFEDKISIPKITPNNPSKKTKTIKLSSKTIAEYEGHYWNEKSLYSRQIYFRNDTLWYEPRACRVLPKEVKTSVGCAMDHSEPELF